MNTPTAIIENVFSGSLCRIRKFETLNGLRYCLTVFSLSDYKHLHFPHDEYEMLIAKLHACLSTHTILPIACNSNVLSIKQEPFDGDFKINFGEHRMTIGSLTAYGLVKTAFFSDVSYANKKQFTCDSKWDICICKTCPAFSRLIDFESTALKLFARRKLKNLIS